MNLKTNYKEQKKYLEKHLEQINIVVGAILGYNPMLKIVQKENRTGTYFELTNSTNVKNLCGIMSQAFSKVTIGTFGVFWFENGVSLSFDFFYETKSTGSNGVEFCKLQILDDVLKLF